MLVMKILRYVMLRFVTFT